MKVASFFAAMLAATTAFGNDFRGHAWGDGIKTVYDTHGSPLVHLADRLVYEMTVARELVLVGFVFDNGRLVQGEYILHLGGRPAPVALYEYDQLNGLFVMRYGLPRDQARTPGPGGNRTDSAVELLSKWHTTHADVRHLLRGSTAGMDHSIVFTPMNG